MKYVVDEIIDDIVKLENLETKEIININIKKLPKSIKEGQILLKKEYYILDKKEESKRRKLIQDKLNTLK